MGSPSVPAAPNAAKTYEQGIQTYLKFLPQLLAAEDQARGGSGPLPGESEDDFRIWTQQAEQQKFGGIQYGQQLDALHQLDPWGAANREVLGGSVLSDLAYGRNPPPDLAAEWTNNIRGAQAARGNVLGNAPVSAETVYKGKLAEDLYQQHLDNAGQFLGLPTPEAQIAQIAPVSADRTSAYTNPSAGYAGQQFALGNYGNQLTASQAQGNPWARALQGVSTAATIANAAGSWGSLLGG